MAKVRYDRQPTFGYLPTPRTVKARTAFSLALLAATTLAGSIAPARSPAAESRPAQGARIVRAVELDWPGLGAKQKQKLLSRLQHCIGQPCTEKSLEEEIPIIFYAAPNYGGKVWFEPFADGVKIVVAVRAVRAE